jgi:hypothetical protein
MERNKGKGFVLTRGQQALWALDRFETNPANYVISAAVTISPRLDKVRLEKVFNEILCRHEALRTLFQVHEQAPLQYVRETASLEIPFTDACDLNESQLRERLREESGKPFDLEKDLPLRLHVFQRAHDSVLLFCVHHIVADFWSLASITETFPRLYAELQSGSFLSSGPSGLGYREFCERSNNWLETGAATRAAEYWKSYLAGPLPVLSLPANPSRTPARWRRTEPPKTSRSTAAMYSVGTAALRTMAMHS